MLNVADVERLVNMDAAEKIKELQGLFKSDFSIPTIMVTAGLVLFPETAEQMFNLLENIPNEGTA
jgi:hypothetical protein